MADWGEGLDGDGDDPAIDGGDRREARSGVLVYGVDASRRGIWNYERPGVRTPASPSTYTLQSLTRADDIVVLASHSTDRTEQICRQYTDKVYQCDFAGFGKLRNRALELVTHDWVLSIDADERVTDELREEIQRELASGPRADAFFVPRKNFFLGRWIRHCGWYPDYRQP